MRDYAKVGPQFWIGKTGKALRKQGIETQLVALYLMTCPQANMLGLYYAPTMFISHETGLGLEGASKGLRGCIEAGFCRYDDDSEVVWVIEMARYQIADALEAKDNRCKGIQNEYSALPENPFLPQFFDMYEEAFHLTNKRECASPSEAPFKVLVSQEQEQEKEQEQEQEQEQKQVAPTASGVATRKKPESETATTWQAYSNSYFARYGTEPVRNATVNGQMANFVKRLGRDEAPHVASFFVGHNNGYYVREMHAVGAMLKDAEKLRTEWATNSRMTQTKALQADKTATNLDAFAPLIAEAKAREEAERNAHAL